MVAPAFYTLEALINTSFTVQGRQLTSLPDVDLQSLELGVGKATGTGLSASLQKQDEFGPRSWPWAESSTGPSTGPSSAPAPAGVRASPGGVGATEAAGHRSCPTISWTRRWWQPGQVRAASYYPQEKGRLESTPHFTPLKFPILGAAPAGFGCPGRVW